MRLCFFNNSLNHHQVHVADEFYKLLGDDYVYVSTVSKEKCGLKGGVDYSSRPYCLQAADSYQNRQIAIEFAKSADVCVFGAESLDYAIIRAKSNPSGLSFELSERWLKRGLLNLLSPRLLKWWWIYQKYFRNANFYKLCASCFAAEDHRKLFTYKNRCYKWGYFTDVDEDYNRNTIGNNDTDSFSMMWCSRFLTWKHPEIPIMMAAKLKKKGYSFTLDMFGDEGNASKHDKVFSRIRIEKLIDKLDVGDRVRLCGSIPNQQIIEAMRNHSIFLFTSDQREGWGAVANESMANGCVLVASECIGSTGFLIDNGFNGLVFDNCNVDSLVDKIEWLITHPNEMAQIRINAINTLKFLWSPKSAAKNLLILIEDLRNGRVSSIEEGPASIAN